LLGEFFPESEKVEFVESILTPGHILRFHVSNTKPPKVKLLLIVGNCQVSPCYGCLVS